MLTQEEREEFTSKFMSPRTQAVIRFTFNHYDEYGDLMIKFDDLLKVGLAVGRRDGKKKEDRMIGHIKFLMKIGFFFVEPTSGLRLNPDYKPRGKHTKIWPKHQ